MQPAALRRKYGLCRDIRVTARHRLVPDHALAVDRL
jgi:hypothetical protein